MIKIPDRVAHDSAYIRRLLSHTHSNQIYTSIRGVPQRHRQRRVPLFALRAPTPIRHRY
jgi:hypothetical protein